MAPKHISGYVLAGGASTRFGTDKALASFDGAPLLVRVSETVRQAVGNVAVVAVPEKYEGLAGVLGDGLQLVADRWPGEGPLGGIITALQNTMAMSPAVRWNLILSCDLPFVSAEWLRFLAEYCATSQHDVVLPHSTHGPEPLCACYRTASCPVLEGQFDAGVRKVTQALKQLRCEVLDERVWKRFDSAGRLFWNMNTHADFTEAQRLWETQA